MKALQLIPPSQRRRGNTSKKVLETQRSIQLRYETRSSRALLVILMPADRPGPPPDDSLWQVAPTLIIARTRK